MGDAVNVIITNRLLRFSIKALLFLPAILEGENIGLLHLQFHTRVRIENELILTWKSNSRVPSDEINVYDLHGSLLTHFGVNSLVPEASGVSVYDMTALPGREIAVAAVYTRPSTMPQGMLLLFDFHGALRSALALAPARAIQSLVLDENSNIWTLTLSSADQPPSAVPMIVEYDSSGRELHSYLRRSDFPAHAEKIQVSPATGHPNMGYAAGSVWFWLPGSTDLVKISASTGDIQRSPTGIPADAGLRPMTVFMLDENSFLLDARKRVTGISEPVRELHVWSAGSRTWVAVSPSPCDISDELIGTSADGRPIFHKATADSLCAGHLSPVNGSK